MALISTNGLCIGYDKKQIVEGLTFSVGEGDFLCVVGENGSGKSTLIKVLLHLTPPLSGELSFGDGLTPKKIGYLPQQTATQGDFPASACEVVLAGTLSSGKWLPFYTGEQKRLADISMSRLGVLDLKHRCFRELSGGQKQRVLLARALCASEKLIILDEPDAALDPDAAKDMYSAVASLNQSGVAVIMVSHDATAALKLATHVLHLSGRPKFFGTSDEYAKTELCKKLMEGGRKNV